MAEQNHPVRDLITRCCIYIISAASFFLIFLFAVTVSTERLDAQLIMTMIIAVMLITFMIYSSRSLETLDQRLLQMAKKKERRYGTVLRLIYYTLSVLSLFLIFILAVALSPERIDAELILTLIIGVLLIALMIYGSQLLKVLHRHLDEIAEKTT